MSVTWGERPNSLRSTGNPQSLTKGYILTGTSSETVARAQAAGYSVVIYSGLYRSDIALTKKGPEVWDVDVTWGPYEKKEQAENDFKWTFSTGGQTRHITQAIAHVGHYTVFGPGTATDGGDCKGVIGVNDDGTAEGCDIVEPAFEWTEDWTLALGSYGWTYSQIVASLTGRVNAASFRGFAAGSVLFKGAEGAQSAKDPLYLTITYRFAYSPNVTGQAIGDISGIAKKGHEYLWVQSRSVHVAAGDIQLPKRPSLVSVEQVYYSGDFSLLGIGTT